MEALVRIDEMVVIKTTRGSVRIGKNAGRADCELLEGILHSQAAARFRDLFDLGDQLALVCALKQLQPRLRDVLELRRHNTLDLVADLQLAVLHCLHKHLNRLSCFRKEVGHDKASYR